MNEAVRERAIRERQEQGLPPGIEDPAALIPIARAIYERRRTAAAAAA